jgi:hypothetical protein
VVVAQKVQIQAFDDTTICRLDCVNTRVNNKYCFINVNRVKEKVHLSGYLKRVKREHFLGFEFSTFYSYLCLNSGFVKK